MPRPIFQALAEMPPGEQRAIKRRAVLQTWISWRGAVHVGGNFLLLIAAVMIGFGLSLEGFSPTVANLTSAAVFFGGFYLLFRWMNSIFEQNIADALSQCSNHNDNL